MSLAYALHGLVRACGNNMPVFFIQDGLDFSNDPLLQGRNFSYLDTQTKRLGGPNFTHIPINAPRLSVPNPATRRTHGNVQPKRARPSLDEKSASSAARVSTPKAAAAEGTDIVIVASVVGGQLVTRISRLQASPSVCDRDGIVILRSVGHGPGNSMVTIEATIDNSQSPALVLGWRTIR